MSENHLNDNISILIAEDSKTQAEILRHLLENAGYIVHVAYNGREAFERIRDSSPSLILTDIMMPEMNGYDLCRRVKNNPETRDIPVILVTQLFDPKDVIEGLECGADNFIIKPYGAKYLLERINVILANKIINTEDNEKEGINVFFSGQTHIISSNRQKILNILLSTYELAIIKNNELEEAKERLASVNEQLSEANDELVKINDDLVNEISERKRVEQALFQANKKLSLLSSITRHDMKNTMMALLSYNELAKLDNSQVNLTNYISKESSLLSRLSAQIEFTRLYEELGVKGAIWTDIGVLLKKIGLSFSSVTLSIDDTINSYVIFADPLIEKVFYNLFDNAIRHGEHVTTISVTMIERETHLEISIADDGIGVFEDDKEMIFGRGYGKNTGLGLFLVREILSITDITIVENGKPGEGASFVLKVPQIHYRKNQSPLMNIT